MKCTNTISWFLLLSAAVALAECKGGRGGGGGRWGGSRGSSSSGGWFSSKSSSSSSGGWFSSKSSSSPSSSGGWFSSKSSSSPSSSGGWFSLKSSSSPSSSGGWFSSKSSSSSRSSSSTKSYGAPPAYPGLGNRPVSHPYKPPAYTPTYNAKPYGTAFGSSGLPRNTYIQKNYYGGPGGYTSNQGYHNGGGGYLTNALFFRTGMHSNSYGGQSSYRRDSWDESDDRRWRETTKAPYFENKVPGSESSLPAAAVVGAATAFGLASLLPLNVPAHKPFMYCNGVEVAQSKIQLDDKIYSCRKNSILISCPRLLENATIVDECPNTIMQCDIREYISNIYCSDATLKSRQARMCNSTKAMAIGNDDEVSTILNCYLGALPKKLASSIPTTTERPEEIKKELSFGASVHVFLLKLSGQSDVLKVKEDKCDFELCKADPQVVEKEKQTRWIPEALTIPPELTEETTTQAPFTLRSTSYPSMHDLPDSISEDRSRTKLLDDFEVSQASSTPKYKSTNELVDEYQDANRKKDEEATTTVASITTESMTFDYKEADYFEKDFL